VSPADGLNFNQSGLSPTQKAFADLIMHDLLELLHDDNRLLGIIRTGLTLKAVEGFYSDICVGVKNYDRIRTEQIRRIQDELRRVVNLMPQSVIPHAIQLCPVCGSANGFHVITCDRQEFAHMQEPPMGNHCTAECGQGTEALCYKKGCQAEGIK
jgi:hypothetical protein